MGKWRAIALAAAGVTATTALTGGLAISASATVQAKGFFIARETGYGATLVQAKDAAFTMINDDYYGCTHPFALVGDGTEPDGTWWATMASNCTGLR